MSSSNLQTVLYSCHGLEMHFERKKGAVGGAEVSERKGRWNECEIVSETDVEELSHGLLYRNEVNEI